MIVTILIYIYPLKAVFGSMWYFLSDGRVGQRLGISSPAQARALFAIYALGFTAIALEILLLNLRAWRLREPLRLNARERLMTRGELMGWSIPASVGIVSLVPGIDLANTGARVERLGVFLDGPSRAGVLQVSQPRAEERREWGRANFEWGRLAI
jgi:hypothetical protein